MGCASCRTQPSCGQVVQARPRKFQVFCAQQGAQRVRAAQLDGTACAHPRVCACHCVVCACSVCARALGSGGTGFTRYGACRDVCAAGCLPRALKTGRRQGQQRAQRMGAAEHGERERETTHSTHTEPPLPAWKVALVLRALRRSARSSTHAASHTPPLRHHGQAACLRVLTRGTAAAMPPQPR